MMNSGKLKKMARLGICLLKVEIKTDFELLWKTVMWSLGFFAISLVLRKACRDQRIWAQPRAVLLTEDHWNCVLCDNITFGRADTAIIINNVTHTFSIHSFHPHNTISSSDSSNSKIRNNTSYSHLQYHIHRKNLEYDRGKEKARRKLYLSPDDRCNS